MGEIKQIIPEQEPASNNAIVTAHKLNFETADYEKNVLGEQQLKWFKVGTCRGMCTTDKAYIVVIALVNDSKHNGHLEDVFQWFEFSAKNIKKDLMFIVENNEDFKKHLIGKRGFTDAGGSKLIKKIYRK